jgi:hypothetical protein
MPYCKCWNYISITRDLLHSCHLRSLEIVFIRLESAGDLLNLLEFIGIELPAKSFCTHFR